MKKINQYFFGMDQISGLDFILFYGVFFIGLAALLLCSAAKLQLMFM